MNDNKILTIAVPTYNRADNLALLLKTLGVELAGLEAYVDVIVADNASLDHTVAVTAAFAQAWPSAKVLRHDVNLGADENFCRCIDITTTRYFWLIGDDDLPKTGVIRQLVALLQQQKPALVYMQSEWVARIDNAQQGSPIAALRTEAMDSVAFAQHVHVWFTFISGTIVDREELMRLLQGQPIRHYTGSNLVQLGWVLPLLKSEHTFIFVHDAAVLATKGNSGGYALLTVFGINFTRIAKQCFPHHGKLARALIVGNLSRYLPDVVWTTRTARDGRHSEEDPWPTMRTLLGGSPWYWALIVPMGKFPRPLATPFFLTWRVFCRLDRIVLRLRRRWLPAK